MLPSWAIDYLSENPVPSIGILLSCCMSVEFKWPPNNIGSHIAANCLPGFEGKVLLLKIPHISNTWLGAISLVLNCQPLKSGSPRTRKCWTSWQMRGAIHRPAKLSSPRSVTGDRLATYTQWWRSGTFIWKAANSSLVGHKVYSTGKIHKWYSQL